MAPAHLLWSSRSVLVLTGLVLAIVEVAAWQPTRMSLQPGSPASTDLNRRGALATTVQGAVAWTGVLAMGGTPATQAIGDLPEVAPLGRVPAHVVVNTNQMDELVTFFTKGVGLQLLRSEKTPDGREVNYVGFGPEQLAIPPGFRVGVSTFADYGGHVSLKLVSAPPDTPLNAGFGVAYLKLGVPNYRFSKILEFGGEVITAYGYIYCRAPGGLPLQIILGDQPRDPLMFAGLYVKDLKKAGAFYQGLGMQQVPFPYAREKTPSPFEPLQPKGSVYLAYDPDTFGVLLLPCPKEIKKIEVGNVYGGLEVQTDDVGAAAQLLGVPAPADDAPVRRALGLDVDGYGVSFIDFKTEQAAVADGVQAAAKAKAKSKRKAV